MSQYSLYHFNTPLSHPDIDLEVLVVGEKRTWEYAMIASKDYTTRSILGRYIVPLKSSAIEMGNNKRLKGSLWGVKKWWKEKESESWCHVEFHDRTLNMNYEATQTSYNGGNFDAVAICYDPCSPRTSLELVWTKVWPGPFCVIIALRRLIINNILWGGRRAQWLPEIRHFLPGTPIALVEVGMWREEDCCISSEEGSQVAKCLGASFVRWSLDRPTSAFTELAKFAFIAQERKRSTRG
jgi:hypothetical protein